MIRKVTLEKIILNMADNFTSKDVLNSHKIIFSNNYTTKESLNYITVVFHKLWKTGKLKKVSRGVFTNDPNFIQLDMKNWNSVINYFCQNHNGFVSKEFLWMQKGLTTDWPEKLVIYTNLVTRKQKHGNIEVRPTKITINKETKPIFELYELVQLAEIGNNTHIKALSQHISQNKLKKADIATYKDFFKRRYMKLSKLSIW